MKRVFLVGYMGAGKTTVGKELAKLAGLAACSLGENRQHLTAFQDINTMLDCSPVRTTAAHRESTQNFIDSAQNRHKQL